MKVFAAVMILGSFLVPIVASDDPATEHEIYDECDHHCEHTCATINQPLICSQICLEGYICEKGYVREYEDGPCILPSECP